MTIMIGDPLKTNNQKKLIGTFANTSPVVAFTTLDFLHNL